MNYPKGTSRFLEQNNFIKDDNTQPVEREKRIILNAGNRGMKLEDDINQSNEFYLRENKAVITKRPTPVNVVKVDYSKGAIITQAYFEKPSTTDYNGVYKGKYLDFEAKNTISKTSFPMSNIYPHQIDHLDNILKHGGIGFFIISFESYDETYILTARYVIEFYRNSKRKSIPYDQVKDVGYLITKGLNPRLDYLPIIDKIFNL